MSTSPIQANLAPAWKQEVNRRIAAHRSRKDGSGTAADPQEQVHAVAGSRASEAAARVAARFASAPSYSEVLAGEARAAVRAAEAASRAALEAQAAAESVLAGLEAAAAATEPAWEPQPVAVTPEPRMPALRIAESRVVESRVVESRVVEPRVVESRIAESRIAETPAPISYAVRWEPDFPVRASEPEAAQAVGSDFLEGEADAWRRSLQPAEEDEEIRPVEPAQPIHANLIEFPRELVATRKVRPRLAEAATGEPGGQLSIFEVDPAEIGAEPLAEAQAAPAWQEPEWSNMKLDAEPAVPLLVTSTAAEPAEPELELAPMSRRLLALVVDGALVMAAFLAAASVAAAHVAELPAMRTVEMGASAALAAIAMAYMALFLTLARATPGMKYAGIRLSTLEGQPVSRAQRWSRLGALALSLLPLGLGVAWVLFDEDRLSWHDRLSGTYLKKA